MSMAMKAPRPSVQLVPSVVAPVRDRGPLLDPAEVAARIFSGKCGWRWVLDNAPHEYRVKVGKRICFHATDMLAWKEQLQGSAAR